jgi:anti-sigma B factor antagonist
MAFTEPEFQLTREEPDAGTEVISVRGEIHVSTAPEFSEALDQAIDNGNSAVVLDLEQVGFIDSTGLSVLLNALRRITRRRGRLALVVNNPTVLRLFHITRLDSTFSIFDSRREALAHAHADGGSSAGAP